MVSIIRASENYAGLAWVRSDSTYRRQAAANGNRAWSRINPSLYSLCFTGKAQMVNGCDLCLASSYRTRECSLASEDDPDLPGRLRAVESAVVGFAHAGVGNPTERRQPSHYHHSQDEVCRVWNERRCHFKQC